MPGCESTYVLLLPLMWIGSFYPPMEMTVVGLFRQSPIAFAIEVLPTPGGPVNRRTMPVYELIRLFLAMNSRMRSFVSVMP